MLLLSLGLRAGERPVVSDGVLMSRKLGEGVKTPE
jgi:hypothetical protein